MTLSNGGLTAVPGPGVDRPRATHVQLPGTFQTLEEGLAERTRVGVVGCGLIAQVMHLPYLAELDDRYEISALCDISSDVLGACARKYRVARTFTRWEDLVGEPLDAVLVLTPGSHAPIAAAAATAGLHVFSEKPLCLSVAEGQELLAAAERAGVCLMVGTMKRYDPAYERLATLVAGLEDLRLVRVTTLESPLEPYVAHYGLRTADDVPTATIAALGADDDARVELALGAVDDETRHAYRVVLLDCLVHELNTLRGVLGEPDRVTHASLSSTCVSVNLDFSGVPCHLSWVDLPGIARYHQEFAFYAPLRRVTLALPSPFLRSTPSELIIEDGDPVGPRASRTVEVIDYEEAFKLELIEFSECIRTGHEPRTPGIDGLRDVALCEAIVRAHLTGAPVGRPTALTPAESEVARR
jgi:predicted dehydrogenase